MKQASGAHAVGYRACSGVSFSDSLTPLYKSTQRQHKDRPSYDGSGQSAQVKSVSRETPGNGRLVDAAHTPTSWSVAETSPE